MPIKEGKIGPISYALHGQNAAQETVVFLNGVMAFASSWAVLVRDVNRQGFAALTHDFRGQALSKPPSGPYTFAMHVSDLCAVLDELNLTKVHLVGTSYGGEVGLKAALMMPKRVQSLTLINAASELDASLSKSIEDWISVARQYDGGQFFDRIVKPLYHPNFVLKHPGFIKKAHATMAAMPAAYFDGQITLYETFLSELHLTEKLGKITCPVLVICGADDVLKPPYFSERIAQSITQSEYALIPNCGHVTLYEKPAVLSTLVLGFLTKYR